MSCIYSVFHYCRTLLNIIVLYYSLIVHYYHHGIIISKCQDITDIDTHINMVSGRSRGAGGPVFPFFGVFFTKAMFKNKNQY